jgi:hypothetical protein
MRGRVPSLTGLIPLSLAYPHLRAGLMNAVAGATKPCSFDGTG